QVTGTYFNHAGGGGPARSENVVFYARGNRAPGKVIKAYDEVLGAPDGPPGSFLITLPRPLMLGAGKFWVSVQANMDYGSSGEWAWRNRAVRRGIKAAWKNPPGAFNTGCANYQHAQHCDRIYGWSTGPGYMFAILGERQTP